MITVAQVEYLRPQLEASVRRAHARYTAPLGPGESLQDRYEHLHTGGPESPGVYHDDDVGWMAWSLPNGEDGDCLTVTAAELGLAPTDTPDSFDPHLDDDLDDDLDDGAPGTR